MPRATPLSPGERRAALIDATLPLLTVHGRSVTTRQIAEAAGVAEGTIFRVFDTKDDLVDAAVEAAFAPGQLLGVIRAIPAQQPLRARAVALVTLLQDRFAEMFALMRAVGMVAPPDHHDRTPEQRRVAEETLNAMIDVIRPDQAVLTVPATLVVQRLRLLTFSASHPDITGGEVLSPSDIADTVLYGAVARAGVEP